MYIGLSKLQKKKKSVMKILKLVTVQLVLIGYKDTNI